MLSKRNNDFGPPNACFAMARLCDTQSGGLLGRLIAEGGGTTSGVVCVASCAFSRAKRPPIESALVLLPENLTGGHIDEMDATTGQAFNRFVLIPITIRHVSSNHVLDELISVRAAIERRLHLSPVFSIAPIPP